MSRRRRRISPRPAASRSCPSKRMLPDVGAMRRSVRRPSVLLPDPDSPTRPSVSPAWMSSDTSSTARTSYGEPRAFPAKTDWACGKIFVRLRISSRGIERIVAELAEIKRRIHAIFTDPRLPGTTARDASRGTLRRKDLSKAKNPCCCREMCPPLSRCDHGHGCQRRDQAHELPSSEVLFEEKTSPKHSDSRIKR